MNEDILQRLIQDRVNAAALLRASFKAFVKVFHYYTFRNEFIFKPFHDDIIKKLEELVFGTAKKRNLYIGISPRFGKSQIMQYFIAWSYAINPRCNFIMTSYGDSLVLKFSAQSKAIVSSELFYTLFGAKLVKDTTAKDLWKIQNGGDFRASSLKGIITGFGYGATEDDYAGALIVDDALKADNYKSAIEKKNCIDIYTNTLKSRANNPNAPKIIIAQRLAKDDLVGWLMENEPDEWDFFIVPTLQDELSIWEEKITTETLLKMRETNPYLFYSQYQQTPIILGGSVIKEEWFKFYPTQDVKFKRLFMTADTAQKTKEYNDYSCVLLSGITDKNELYLIDMIHGKWEAPDLERQVLSFWNKWKDGINHCRVGQLYIEDKASGTGLIQSIRRKGGVPITALQRDKDKLQRLYDIIGYIESGLVYCPMNKSYDISAKIIGECTAFCADMSHAHDDIVDTLIDAVYIAFQKQPMAINPDWRKEIN